MGQPDHSYDVFFSYHGPDRAAVEGVAQALRRQGLKVFLDRWYLVPGRPWPQALEEAIASCRAVAVFVGPYGLGPWQQREKNLALSRWARQPEFPVIPVLLPGADPALDFLSQNTWVDLRQDLDDPLPLEILQAAVRGEPPGPDLKARVRATLAAVCPYRGLRPFREEDAPFFFGREVFVDRLAQAVCCRSLVAVVGASGCGKSSVARAGLLPRVRQSLGGQVWDAVTLLPDQFPLHNLAAALLPLLEPEMTEVDRLAEVNKLAAYFQQGDLALRDVAARVLAKQPGTDRLLLVVDQWEELYTRTREEEQRGRFLDEMLAATQDSPLTVVLTLRGDFFGQALSYRPLADRLQDAVVTLGPMTREELALAVERPAAKVGLAFEPGLVERLLDDVGLEPGNLPLLEFALTRLWEERRGGQLLHQVYEDMGRVQGAVARQAEEVYQKLGALEQQAAIRVFLELVQAGENTEDTRRRAALSDLGGETRDLVKKLADARLVVTGREEASGQDLVEVAHEALIRHWQRLQGWLNADREFLLWRQRLRHDLEDWQRTGQDEGALLRGAQLVEAQDWLDRRPEDLGEGERRFIQAGVVLKEREEEEKREKQKKELEQAQALAAEQQRRAETERRARRRLSYLSVAMLLAFLGAIGASLYAWDQRNQAVSQERIAREQTILAKMQADIAISRQLAAQVNKIIDSDIDKALLLSVEACRIAETEEAKQALLMALEKEPFIKTILHNQSTAAFSPDGRLLAAAGGDKMIGGRILLWDVENRQPLGPLLKGHKGRVTRLAFSPDGRNLASEGQDGTIIIWDIKNFQPLGPPLTGIIPTFSPDGRILAGVGKEGAIFIWDPKNVKPLGQPLTGHKGGIGGLVFSPNGHILASGGDNAILLWELEKGRPLGPPLVGHKKVVVSANNGMRLLQGGLSAFAFSPDGRTLASGGYDSAIIFWDVETRRPLRPPFKGSQGPVSKVIFSPDGRTLASGSWDGTILLWDTQNFKPLGPPLTAHKDGVTSLAFSPDGQILAAGISDDILLWDVKTRQTLSPLKGRVKGWLPLLSRNYVHTLFFNPNGNAMVSVNDSGCTIIWDVKTRKPLSPFLKGRRESMSLRSVAFSPDGKVLAVIGDYDLTLWNIATRQPLRPPLTEPKSIRSVAFSPDGKILACGIGKFYGKAEDQVIFLLDTLNYKSLGVLRGHSDFVNSVAFTPDGRTLASGSSDKTIILWDLNNHQPRCPPLNGHEGRVFSVAFSPDGRTLASGSDDCTVILWDTKTYQPLGPPLEGHEYRVNSVDFSPDGKTLASGGNDGTIILWDVENRKPLGPPMQGGYVQTIAFSPDGKTLASGNSHEGTILLWDVQTRQALGPPLKGGPSPYVASVSFSPDGKILASGYADGLIILWDTETHQLLGTSGTPIKEAYQRESPTKFFSQKWLERACAMANRNLDRGEWEGYMGERPYRKTCPDLPGPED